MKKSLNYIAMAGQWVAAFLLLIGIMVEIHYAADLGFIAVTIGACCFAITTKVREMYYKSLTDKKSKVRRRK